ncbi:MAG: hypothetical protein HY619_04700 [Thaumarchaeota archaeon]|nr:hypothetical protein [Nitrososphaerota archaeon]
MVFLETLIPVLRLSDVAMTVRKKADQEWRTVERVRLAGDAVYHLKRTGDESMWLAVRLDPNRGFFADLLKRLEKMEAMLDNFGSDRTKASPSFNDNKGRQIIRCPRCNCGVSEDHNYCGTCGTRIHV